MITEIARAKPVTEAERKRWNQGTTALCAAISRLIERGVLSPDVLKEAQVDARKEAA